MFDDDGHWTPDRKPKALVFAETALVVASIVAALITVIMKGWGWFLAAEWALFTVALLLVIRRKRKAKKSEENLDLDVLRQIR